MKTNTTSGQYPDATQAKTISIGHFTQSLIEEISILENYTQTEGMFITNILEILEDQVSLGIEKAQMLPDKGKNDMLKTLFHMDTLLKIITTKVDDKLFWAIDNVLFEFNKEDAA